MKKSFVIIAAVFAAIACQKEITTDVTSDGYKTIVLSAETTKVAISDDGKSTWEAGDVLAVYDGTQINEFTLTEGAGSNSAKFTGKVAQGATDLIAVYPYAAAVIDQNTCKAVVPARQTIGTRSYGVIMASCKVATPTLAFAPAGAVVRFSVPSGVSKVIFHGEKGALLAAASEQVEVILPNTEGGTYEASVNAGTYNMFNAFVEKSGKLYVKEGNSALTLQDGVIKNLNAIDSSEEAVLINTKDELDAFAANPATSAYLCADIDFNGGAFTPIAEFAKTFNGQNHNLYKFNMNFTSSEAAGTYNAGLFTTLKGATVKNLYIGDFEDKTGYSDASGISINSYTAGSIVNAGVLAGEIIGATIDNVQSYAWIQIAGDCAVIVRCSNLVGKASDTASVINGCSAHIENRHNGTFDNKSDVNAKTIALAGILAYDNAGCTITKCENYAEFIINNRQCRYVAGIVGRAEEGNVQFVSLCENYGSISSTLPNNGQALYFQEKSFYGGISAFLADKSSVIDHCKNHGDMNVKCGYKKGENATDVRFFVGGIVGSCGGSVTYCENDGDFTYNNHNSPQKTGCPRFGGIAGSDATPVRIDNCTNTGNILNVSAGKDYSSYGGIIGTLASNKAIISNCSVNCSIKSTMNVKDYSKFFVGGLVGYFMNKVTTDVPNCVGCSVNGEFTTIGGEYAAMVIGNSDAGEVGTYVIGSVESPILVSGVCGKAASPYEVVEGEENLHCLSDGYNNPSFATVYAVYNE